jgi:hypothetical protein
MNIIIPDHAIHRAELRMKTPDMEMSEEEKLIVAHEKKYPNAHNVQYSHWADAMFCLTQKVFITPKCAGEFNWTVEGQSPSCEFCDERNVTVLKEFHLELSLE